MRCNKHDKELECLAGGSAHPGNWFCSECDSEECITDLEEQLKTAELAYKDLWANSLERIAELKSTLQELTDLMEDTITGEYTPDSFTTQPARAALGKEIDND